MPKTTVADLELASALRMAVMRLSRRLRQERAGHDLSLTQISALAVLARSGPLTPTELAAAERVQPPSMTRVVAGLEERGLVRRTPHPTDRRQVLITVTDAARSVIDEDRRRRTAWLVDHLAALGPDELELLRGAAPVLERLAAAE
jgi:DNA-binding MarR family transcriptional regulator